MNLETSSVNHLSVYSNPYDIRRDIHTYVQYCREREVKRTYRENRLPKAEARRLAKLMSHPDCLADVEKEGQSWWLEAIDNLAYRLGFIDYDTEGEYAGYTSRSPSFADNYIEYQPDVYNEFLALSLIEQEKRLFYLLRDDPKHNEFYNRHLQSSLNPFGNWGSATGVMPHLDFPQIRRFLFGLLAELESGVWYTTASFISYLQTHHPYFLIPPLETLPQKDRWDRPLNLKRYENFREYDRKEYYRSRDPIPDDAPDGFARVEGRYIERFLEGIPLTLGYVAVAYSPEPYQGLMPERGTLQAFRLHEPFRRLMTGRPVTPRVTVLPTFEIHIDSPFYPAGLLKRLAAFTTVVKEDRVTILKLEKTGVKAALASDDTLDIPALLQQLTGRALPQNVAVELEEWAGQSDAFTLFTDLALLEGDPDLPEIAGYVEVTITPQLRLLRQPAAAFQALEEAERIPLTITHGNQRLTPLPKAARTIFPRQPAEKVKAKGKTKPKITLQQEIRLTLHAPTKTFYKALRKALLKQRCLIEADANRKTITYSQVYQPQVDAALKALRASYQITLKEKAA